MCSEGALSEIRNTRIEQNLDLNIGPLLINDYVSAHRDIDIEIYAKTRGYEN